MFTVMKWIGQEGISGFLRFLWGMIMGALLAGFILFFLGKSVFYFSAILEGFKVSAIFAGAIIGGVLGMSTGTALYFSIPSDLKYPFMPMGHALGMVFGEAFGAFIILARTNRPIATGFALAFALVIGLILEVYIRIKKIKPYGGKEFPDSEK